MIPGSVALQPRRAASQHPPISHLVSKQELLQADGTAQHQPGLPDAAWCLPDMCCCCFRFLKDLILGTQAAVLHHSADTVLCFRNQVVLSSALP